MPYTVLDPRLIACPTPDSGIQLEVYAECLTDWFEFHNEDWCHVYRLKNLANYLFDKDLYPLVDPIRELINASENSFQLNDLIKLTNYFLQQLPTLEGSLDIDDLEYEVLCESTDDHILKEALDRLIALSLVKRNKESISCSEIAISNTDEDLNYSCLIKTILYSNSTLTENEFEGDGNIKCLSTKEFLCCSVNPEFFLNRLSDESICKAAILTSAIKMAKDKDLDVDYSDLDKFYIGIDFLKTINDLHFHNDIKKLRMLLRSTAETILEINLDQTHHLRIGKGPSDKQKTKNDWFAWRKDIDREYHLHYWLKNNIICFSNVVPHKTMSISDPPS